MEKPQLKICHVLWNGGIGGIESLCLSLCIEMVQTNTVEILFGKTISNMILPENISYSELNLSSGLDLSPSKYNQAKQHFDKFDLVHLHVYNPVLLKAAIESKAASVYTIHSLTHLRRKRNIKDRVNESISNVLIKKADKVITVSEFAKSELMSFIPKGVEIEVVPNCVSEIYRLISDKERGENKDLRMLSFGRLTSNKRFELLIDLVSELITQNIDVSCKIFGEGPEENDLKKRINELELEDHVQIFPFTYEIDKEILQTDICVFPFHKESFGLSLLEAISLGVPSFCLNDGGGMVETLANLENMFVASDVQSLNRKVSAYVRLDDLEKKILRKELKLLSDQYNSSLISNKYISLYLQVCGRS